MTAPQFEEAAGRGKFVRAENDPLVDLDNVLKGDKPATDINVGMGSRLSEEYESGKLLERIQQSGAHVIDDNAGTLIVGKTQADAERLQRAHDLMNRGGKPIDLGRAYG